MPPINANVTNQQITASVGETQIDVSVSGGVGPTGAAGAAASVQVGTVTTGAPGSSASVVNAGTGSAAVLNFTIPAGATGATGNTGPQGERGEQGIQGIQGVAGIQGPAGPAGAAGAQGPKGDTGDSGVAAATAPVTYDSGTKRVALSIGTGLTTSSGSLALAPHGLSHSVSGSDPISAASIGAVLASDARLTNARVPLSHASSHGSSGTDPITPAAIGAAAASHEHGAAAITSGTLDIARIPTGQTSTTVPLGNDARFTDARTPLAHNHSSSEISDFAAAVAAASPEELVEYATAATFPATGNASLLYIATDSARAYRWVGSQYAEIGATSISVAANQTITLTGDVTGSGTGSFAATLANSGVSAGTYRSVTVDAKGRVTAGTNPPGGVSLGLVLALS
jgi:hypothetical protein